MRILIAALRGIWLAGVLACAGVGVAQERNTVTLQVELSASGSGKAVAQRKTRDLSNVVVWLKPLDSSATSAVEAAKQRPKLIQKNKTFEPHLVVVPVGSTVDFPNHDPFFHNVFSVFDGKRFDLGLYEAGTTNSVRFDKPGISFLFCNIHPEMNAVVVALDTPYFGTSNKAGGVSIPGVPTGRYELHVWYERSSSESLRHLTRTLEVSSSNSDLGTIAVPENQQPMAQHKNKYGQDYAPPPPDTYTPH
jgi:plastocyanin